MPEWVLYLAPAITVKLIFDRANYGRPGRNRLPRDSVHVLDVQVEIHTGSAQAERAHYAHVGILVRQHDAGVADFELGMPDPPVIVETA